MALRINATIVPPTLDEILAYYDNTKPGVFGVFNPQEGRQINILTLITNKEYFEHGLTAEIGQVITQEDDTFGDVIPEGVTGYMPNIYPTIDEETKLQNYADYLGKVREDIVTQFSAPLNPNDIPPELDLLSTSGFSAGNSNW